MSDKDLTQFSPLFSRREARTEDLNLAQSLVCFLLWWVKLAEFAVTNSGFIHLTKLLIQIEWISRWDLSVPCLPLWQASMALTVLL